MPAAATALRAMVPGEQFTCAEEAWFWTCGALIARRDGYRRHHATVRRNCEPDDIVLCIERLLQTGSLTDAHARVLGQWGQLGWRPSAVGRERAAALLWREAMEILDAALVRKGILARGLSSDYFP
jgi:hypothetical protein